MFSDVDVCDRVGELYELCAREIGKSPGEVLNQLARSELTECDRVIAFIEKTPGLSSEDLVECLRNGAHRT